MIRSSSLRLKRTNPRIFSICFRNCEKRRPAVSPCATRQCLLAAGAASANASTPSVEKRAPLLTPSVRDRKKLWPAVAIVLILIATALELHRQGRLWRCACPQFLWTADAWSSQTSQLFLDPYSLTHVLHGVMFAGLVALVSSRLRLGWRLVVG